MFYPYAVKILDYFSENEANTSARISVGALRGRTFQSEETRPLTCLERAWEGIKNFSARLWNALFCENSVVEPRRLPVRPIRSFRQPSFPVSTVTTNPLTTPRTAVSPPLQTVQQAINTTTTHPAVIPTPAQIQTTASTTAAPSSNRSQTAPQSVEKEKLPPPPFSPLQVLAEKREAEVSYAPQLALTQALPEPSGFTLLDEVKQHLPPPEIKLGPYGGLQQLERLKTHFILKMRTLFRELLNGEVKLGSHEKMETFQGEISSPEQIAQAKAFILEQLEAFNDALKRHVGSTAIDEASVFDKFQILETAVPLWEGLYKVAQQPQLTPDEIQVLSECTAQLPAPDNAFYQDFPLITKRMQELVAHCGSKLLVGQIAEESVEKIHADVESKLGVPFHPLTPEVLLQNHLNTFLLRLRQDVLQLFQVPSEQESMPKLEIGHLVEISDYVEREVSRLNSAAEEYLKANSSNESSFSPVDPEDFARQLFMGVMPLVDSWRMMQLMVSSENGVGEKSSLLTDIAHALPEKEDPIWTQFPLIKEAMGATLLPLAFTHFSNYTFDQVGSSQNREKYEQDQLRQATIESAFELMATKLGCEAPKPPQIDMNVDNDETLREERNRDMCLKYAQSLEILYDQNLELFDGNSQMALQQTAENLRMRLDQISESDRLVACQLVISSLPEEINVPLARKFPEYFS